MRVRRFVGAAIVTICIGVPLAETFDNWDRTFVDGNDTEANLVIAALCVGFAFSIATKPLITGLRLLPVHVRPQLRRQSAVLSSLHASVPPVPTGSPPTSLRI